MTLAILHFLILFHFVFSDVGSLRKKVRETVCRVFSCQVPRLTWSRSGGTWRQLWRLSGVGVGSPSHTRGSGNLTRVVPTGYSPFPLNKFRYFSPRKSCPWRPRGVGPLTEGFRASVFLTLPQVRHVLKMCADVQVVLIRTLQGHEIITFSNKSVDEHFCSYWAASGARDSLIPRPIRVPSIADRPRRPRPHKQFFLLWCFWTPLWCCTKKS